MSTTIEFHVGDKVRLRNIGPVMGIINIEYTSQQKILYVECEWVSPKMKRYTERFRPDEIIHVHEDKADSI